MTYWIFKVSELGAYPDSPGREYIYDNTHSVKVRSGDEFLYLEKAGAKYGLTGAGRVEKVTRRAPKDNERHNNRVNSVFTAHLMDLVWFSKPYSLSNRTTAGRNNRRLAHLPDDLNAIGWSISMPRLDREVFVRLLDAAMESGPPNSADEVEEVLRDEDWRVEDSWSLVKQRRRLQRFRSKVLERHCFTCFVCGTQLRAVLEVAHLRDYAGHPEHRANPANGVCMCSFCHAAFDAGEITLHPDGSVVSRTRNGDAIADAHFHSISAGQRQSWLAGIDRTFFNTSPRSNRQNTDCGSDTACDRPTAMNLP